MKSKGFTLIELMILTKLLIVVAIIGTLAAIVVPALKGHASSSPTPAPEAQLVAPTAAPATPASGASQRSGGMHWQPCPPFPA
jgi:Tfp pilus assembly protein PilE